MRSAFGSALTPQPKPSRFQALRQDVSEIAANDLAAGGQGLPISTRLAHEIADLGDQQTQKMLALENQIADLKREALMRTSPEYARVQALSSNAQVVVEDAVQALYGDTASLSPVIQSQKALLNGVVADHLRELIEKKDFTTLNQLQKPQNLRKLVSEFAQQVVPPKAQQVLAAEFERSRPPDSNRLLAETTEAVAKAKAATTPQEMRQWSKIAQDKRRAMLAARFAPKR